MLQRKAFKLPEDVDKQTAELSNSSISYSVDKFIYNISKVLELNGKELSVFSSNVRRHSKNQSADKLQKEAFNFFCRDLPNDQKKAIAEKVVEGVKLCTGGYRDRLSEILMAAQFIFDVPHCLEAIRSSLIQRAAACLSDEVHARNSFFRVASKIMHFGVRYNQEDGHRGMFSDNNIRHLVSSSFENHYLPMQIFGQLYDELVSQFYALEYEGRSDEDVGYPSGSFEPWRQMLKTFFSMETVPNYQDLFILNEDWAIIDINFQYIKEILLKHLIDNYFKLPDTLSQSLSLIFSEKAVDDLEAEGVRAIIKEKEWLELIRLCPEHNKNLLIELYLARGENDQERVNLMINLLSLLPKTIKPEHPAIRNLSLLDRTEIKNRIVSEEALLQLLRWVPELDNEKKYFLLNQLIEKQGTAEGQLGWLLSQFDRDGEEHWKKLLQEKIDIYMGLTFPDSGRIVEKIKQNEAATRLFLRAQTQLDHLHISTDELGLYFSVLIEYRPNLIDQYFKLLEKKFPVKEELITFLAVFFQSNKVVLHQLMKQESTRTDNILEVLKALLYRDPSQSFEILNGVDDRGMNLLMLAVSFYPDAVQFIVDFVLFLDPAKKFEILSTRNASGENALLIAINQHPEVLPFLLDVIDSLDMEQKLDILSAEMGLEQYNALVRAAEMHPKSLPRLLDIAYSLAPEKRSLILDPLCNFYVKRLLTAVQNGPADIMACLEQINRMEPVQVARVISKALDKGGFELMSAINNEPVVLAPLMDGLIYLPQLEKYELLSQVNDLGYNKLQQAILNYPAALVPMLKILDSLKNAQIIAILRHDNKTGLKSALMMAAKLAPYGINSFGINLLLEAIKKLDASQQFELLSQVNDRNCSSLMLAVRYSPDYAESFLEAVLSLKAFERDNILELIDKDGWNLLMMAVRYAPHLVSRILEVLSPVQAVNMLSQVETNGCDALNLAFMHQPNLIPCLLKVIDSLDMQNRKKIIDRVDVLNVAKHQPEALPLLLDAIYRLDPEKHALLLKSLCTFYAETLLTGGESKKDTFKAMKIIGMKPEQIFQVLKYIAEQDDGWNKLINDSEIDSKSTFKHNIHELKGLIHQLDAEQQFDILTTKNARDNTILMEAFKSYSPDRPWLLNLLTNIVDNFTSVQIETILTQRDNNGLTVLESACRSDRGESWSLNILNVLFLMQALEPYAIVDILDQVSEKNWSRILVHETYNNANFEFVLKLLSFYPVDKQKKIITDAYWHRFTLGDCPRLTQLYENPSYWEYYNYISGIRNGYRFDWKSLTKYPALFRFLPDSQYNLIHIRSAIKWSSDMIKFLPDHLKSAVETIEATENQETLGLRDVNTILCQWLDDYIERQSIRKQESMQSLFSQVYSFFVPSPYQADTKISAAIKLKQLLRLKEEEAAGIEFSSSEKKALLDGRLYRLWSSNESLLGVDIRNRIMQSQPSEVTPLLGSRL